MERNNNKRRGQGGRQGDKRVRSFVELDDRGQDSADSLIIEGKNAVLEAVQSGREIDKIFFAQGSAGSVGNIIALARKSGITVQECDRRKLDKLSQTGAHQGIIAQCAAAKYSEIDDIFALAESRGEKPLIVLCDGITDPHNLGAIIRSCEIAGAHGVILPKRRSAGLNGACSKAAAGALEYIPIVKCSNLQQAVEELKERGVFIFAADMGGKPMYEADFSLPCGIVIGAEGEGISKIVRDSSDFVVSIPQKGRISSLNASNAAAVLLFEVYRQRG